MTLRTRASLLLLCCALAACTERRAKDLIGGLEMELGEADAHGVVRMELSHTSALDSGFVLPARGTGDGLFHFRFRLRDAQGRRFRYALFYQNTEYAFPDVDAQGGQHPLAEENFYGSWGRAGDAFHLSEPATEEGIVVEDAFRIMGDPRDEDRFVVDGHRRRWARNPRVGRYAFMLVAMPEEHHAALPPAAGDIRTMQDGHYVNPFWYFMHGPGSTDARVSVAHFSTVLHVVDRPDLGAGIWVQPAEGLSSDAHGATCGDSPELRTNAPFMQFIHYVDASTQFDNIPLVADVLGNAYTPADHDHHQVFFPKDRMIATRPMTTTTPCSTVRSDPDRQVIELRNPASTFGNERKENVGVRSRNGLMYGRHRVKCRLTRLLNDSDMWVGLTNAIWLIYQGAPGNMRRICDKDGYMATYWGGSGDQRVPQVDYAEIDFEILKTPPYCPDNTFPPFRAQTWADHGDRNAWLRSTDDPSRGMITVACTNWDMACHSPADFGVGCRPLEWNGQTFLNHRWDHDYRALTQKSEAPDAELFGGDHYWFEIDWRPTEIFWRIGPDPEHMRVVGYMNDKVTSIPNVQMQLIVTQEFHNTKWWPGSPFEQGFVPFPAKDYVGEIQEVVIE